MFTQTFVEDQESSRKPFTIGFSVLLQVAVLGLLVLVPLLYSHRLPLAQLNSLLIAPPPPAVVVQSKPVISASHHSVRVFDSKTLVAPSRIPDRINPVESPVAPAPDIAISGAASDASALDSTILSAGAPPPPKQVVTKPAEIPHAPGPIHIGTGVAQANLIKKVQPAYPAIARSVRVQGQVEFTAIIGKNGRIENLRLLRGHPLLVDAAKEAITQWEYRPTLLNGEPVEVITSIVVNFTLSQ